MKKPPRKIGIPRCTCPADSDGNIIQEDQNCNYHVISSQQSRTWIEANLWNPNA